MDAVDRIDQLKQDIGLFPEEDDDRLALLCYGDTRTGEMRGFTYGDLRALCDLADAARRWIEYAEAMRIDDMAQAEFYMAAALARLDGEG